MQKIPISSAKLFSVLSSERPMHSALIVGTYSVPPFTETVTGVDVPMNGEAILEILR